MRQKQSEPLAVPRGTGYEKNGKSIKTFWELIMARVISSGDKFLSQSLNEPCGCWVLKTDTHIHTERERHTHIHTHAHTHTHTHIHTHNYCYLACYPIQNQPLCSKTACAGQSGVSATQLLHTHTHTCTHTRICSYKTRTHLPALKDNSVRHKVPHSVSSSLD
jgi:hypothetical protein